MKTSLKNTIENQSVMLKNGAKWIDGSTNTLLPVRTLSHQVIIFNDADNSLSVMTKWKVGMLLGQINHYDDAKEIV